MAQGPALSVCQAFGATGSARSLAGDQGIAWKADHLVLKPAPTDARELGWRADALGIVDPGDPRLSQIVRSRDGRLQVDGWSAWQWLPGSHEPRRWLDIIAAGERLHRSLEHLERPTFLDARTDRWAVADRVAWGELEMSEFLSARHVRPLAAALRPISGRSQLVHGDLTGNVVFSEAHPPGVIDFSPYWRPQAFASAVVVADALVWEGAEPDALEPVLRQSEFGQHLLRALLFRRITDELSPDPENPFLGGGDPYAAEVELARALASV